MIDRRPYATARAVNDASMIGADFAYSDWRDIFLAISDTMATDGLRSTSDWVSAVYVGPIRDGGERWCVVHRRHLFDVIYDPPKALIVALIAPRSGAPVMANPRRPVSPKVMETV